MLNIPSLWTEAMSYKELVEDALWDGRMWGHIERKHENAEVVESEINVGNVRGIGGHGACDVSNHSICFGCGNCCPDPNRDGARVAAGEGVTDDG